MSLESTANRCFVCGPSNSIGLKVRFRLDDDVCRAEFTPQDEHVGYDGVTHGGILFSLLDDVMANWVFLRGERCYTARAEVRYRKPLPIGTPVRLEGRQEKRRGRLATLSGKIIRQDDDSVVAEASARFMVEARPHGRVRAPSRARSRALAPLHAPRLPPSEKW